MSCTYSIAHRETRPRRQRRLPWLALCAVVAGCGLIADFPDPPDGAGVDGDGDLDGDADTDSDTDTDADADADAESCDGVTCLDGEECFDGRCVSSRDDDDDGYPVYRDCDDNDELIYPGTTIVCFTGCGEGVSRCGEDGTWGACEHEVNPCDLPHAESACVDDECVVTGCVDGWSHCDASESNGCETNGPCGSEGDTCAEGLACVLECSTDTCLGLCVIRVCAGAYEAVTALIDCEQEQCVDECTVPSAPECEPCLVSNCGETRDACLAAEC